MPWVRCGGALGEVGGCPAWVRCGGALGEVGCALGWGGGGDGWSSVV